VNGVLEAGVREGTEAVTGQAEWLVIVRRDQPGLYRHLRQEFEGIGLVEVILDRRQGEELPGLAPAPTGRRHPVTPKELARWRSLGYRVVPRHDNPGVGPLPA
jgi:hypothetical protein